MRPVTPGKVVSAFYSFIDFILPERFGFSEKSLKIKKGKGTDFSVLSPHSFYSRIVVLALQPISGNAHITGGSFLRSKLIVPALFPLLQRLHAACLLLPLTDWKQ